ncbi:unnamed protein product [Dibothriocephalus latus]|uniref:Protein kinase domain-containing protein n=1 Tax=Dibothriocephalus latus TaxID=60516 RepID=A0A3P7NX28_DIBLA|nr:unnamed protein product [Dibothriocephalus latus]
MKALRGIEAYDLAHHKNISAKAYQLIKRLCRLNPTERLGMGRLGIQEIRNQKYAVFSVSLATFFSSTSLYSSKIMFWIHT